MKVYRPCPQSLATQIDEAIARGDAFSIFHVSGDNSEVDVYWETNDDRDMGIPTESANDRYTVYAAHGLTALQRAVQYTGGSRFGVGQVVSVTVNGVPSIVEEEQ